MEEDNPVENIPPPERAAVDWTPEMLTAAHVEAQRVTATQQVMQRALEEQRAALQQYHVVQEQQYQVAQAMAEQGARMAAAVPFPIVDLHAPLNALPKVEEPQIKLTAEVLLGRSLLDLLRSAPNNPLVRTMIGKHCNKTIPDALKTVEEIIAWVESNVVLNPVTVTADHPGGQTPLRQVNPVLHRRDAAPQETVLTVDLERNYKTHGRCNYTCDSTDYYSSRFTLQEFIAEADEADDMEDLLDRLEEAAARELDDYGAHDSDSSNYQYENHESEDVDDHNTEVSNRGGVIETVRLLLRQHANIIQDVDARDEFIEKFDL